MDLKKILNEIIFFVQLKINYLKSRNDDTYANSELN